MGQLLITDGIFKGGGNMRLTHDRGEILRSVFSCGNDEFIHNLVASGIFRFCNNT